MACGLDILDRNFFGVLPMKGNVVNVLNASEADVLANKELNALMDVLNLNPNTKYNNESELSTLRYRRILILPDQVIRFVK